MQDTSTCQDIFEKVKQILENNGFVLSKLAYLSTDGATNMFGRYNGVVTKIRTKIKNSHSNLTLGLFHCSFLQELCVHTF